MQKSKLPAWAILPSSEPEYEERSLNGILMKGWMAEIPLKGIKAYIDNRRTESHIAELRKTLAKQVPTDDEFFNFIKDDPELEIERLAKDIKQDGLRVPIVIAYDGTLLDGNRRYFAHRWLMKNAEPQIRHKFEKIRAWVLAKEFSSDRDKLRVIVEYNFRDDLKEDWGDYVRAKLLWDEQNDKGFKIDELVELYGAPGFGKSKINEFLKTYEIIALFIQQSSDADHAIAVASGNFIWFQQLQRSYREDIRNDDEFQQMIFKNIREGRIKQTDQLKYLKDVYEHKDAWALFKKGEVDASQDLRKFYAREERERSAPDLSMTEINARLETLVDEDKRVSKVSKDLLENFHQFAERVPGHVVDVNARIDYLIERLESITSAELANLSSGSISKLRRALERVSRQADATKKS